MNTIQQYRLFNLLLAIGISVVFIYPLLFPSLDSSAQIICIHKVMLGKVCNSCGITHDFQQILNGSYYHGASLQNNHSIKVFSFFFSLFISRIFISFIITLRNVSRIVKGDIVWHLLFAAFAFSSFWI
jgi:hypothetical protein